MADDSEDKPTPPVPPTSSDRIPPRAASYDSWEERERVGDCPGDGCLGSILHITRQTGAAMVGTWDPSEFDPEEYDISTTWAEQEELQRCTHCGVEVSLG